MKTKTLFWAMAALLLGFGLSALQGLQAAHTPETQKTAGSGDEQATIDTLNTLIETAKDGENGYRSSAERINNPDLKNHFNAMCQQRQEFAQKLQDQVREMGGEAETEGTVQAAAYRGWMKVKDAAADSDNEVLADVKRGENAALEAYNDALKTDAPLPKDARALVQKQRDMIQKAHDLVQKIEANSSQGVDLSAAIKQSGVRLEKAK